MNPRFLVVDDEQELADLMSMLITEDIDSSEVVIKSNGKQAMEMLASDANYAAIICDYHMNPGNGGEVYQYVRENSLNIPFVLISGGFLSDYPEFSNFETEGKANLFLPKPFDESILISHLKDITSGKVNTEDEVKSKPSEYIKVPIKMLMEYVDLCPNAYIKLGEDKFVLAVRVGEEASTQLEHFKLKGHNWLYMLRADFKRFFEAIFSKLEKLESEKFHRIWEEGFKISQDLAKLIGIDRLVKDVVDKAIEESIKALLAEETLSKKFETIVTEQPFVISHSILSCYLGAMIYQQLSWSSPQILRAHVRASFLHDFYATEEDLSIESTNNQDKLERFFEHANLAAETANQLWPEDQTCESIIRAHHELPDGSGGPKHLRGDGVAAPSAMLILCHLLASELIRRKELQSSTVAHILKSHEGFNTGVYAGIYQATCKTWQVC